MTSSVHSLGSKVSSGKPEGDHDGVQGWGRVLDTPVNPPVLGVGLLYNVVTGLVSFNGDNLK